MEKEKAETLAPKRVGEALNVMKMVSAKEAVNKVFMANGKILQEGNRRRGSFKECALDVKK